MIKEQWLIYCIFHWAKKIFHVYSNMVNWKPHIGRKTSFKREHNNNYNKFAGKTLLIERIGAVTVVHRRAKISSYRLRYES